MEALLGSNVVKKDGSEVSVASFSGSGKVVGLYFSAHWCPPCKAFTPRLAEWYNQQKAGAHGDKIEIVFVSFDRNHAQFQEYFNEMPWLAMDFDSDNKEDLGGQMGVSGIPALIFVDAGTGAVKTKDGRSLVSKGGSVAELL